VDAKIILDLISRRDVRGLLPSRDSGYSPLLVLCAHGNKLLLVLQMAGNWIVCASLRTVLYPGAYNGTFRP
jgi:hypothetical protein